MTVLQIALLVCAAGILRLSAVALVVVRVMGVSRNAEIDEQVFTCTAKSVEYRDESGPFTAPDKTSA